MLRVHCDLYVVAHHARAFSTCGHGTRVRISHGELPVRLCLDNPTAATKQQLYWLGANYQATPALVLIGGAYRAIRNNDGGNGTLLALGANYYLSKRTMLYGTVGTVLNGGNAAFSVEAGNNRPLPGSNQQGVYTGMVHWF